MGPRLVSRGNAYVLDWSNVEIALLQWGRDSLVAEILVDQLFPMSEDQLQWGRDSLVAEIH